MNLREALANLLNVLKCAIPGVNILLRRRYKLLSEIFFVSKDSRQGVSLNERCESALEPEPPRIETRCPWHGRQLIDAPVLASEPRRRCLHARSVPRVIADNQITTLPTALFDGLTSLGQL